MEFSDEQGLRLDELKEHHRQLNNDLFCTDEYRALFYKILDDNPARQEELDLSRVRVEQAAADLDTAAFLDALEHVVNVMDQIRFWMKRRIREFN